MVTPVTRSFMYMEEWLDESTSFHTIFVPEISGVIDIFGVPILLFFPLATSL